MPGVGRTAHLCSIGQDRFCRVEWFIRIRQDRRTISQHLVAVGVVDPVIDALVAGLIKLVPPARRQNAAIGQRRGVQKTTPFTGNAVQIRPVAIDQIKVERAALVVMGAGGVARRGKDDTPIGQVGGKKIAIRTVFFLVEKLTSVGDDNVAVGKGELAKITAINVDFIEPPARIRRPLDQRGGAGKDDLGGIEIHVRRLHIDQAGRGVDKKRAIRIAAHQFTARRKLGQTGAELAGGSFFVAEDRVAGR